MENQIRLELESRRFVMQLLLRLKEFVTRDIDPFLELMNDLNKRRITYQIVELVGVLPEWSSYLKVLFSKSPYKNYGFLKVQFEFEKTHSLVAEFHNKYPSTHIFQYKPNVPQISSLSNTQETFNHILTNMHLVDQKVYVYYFKYAVVVEIFLHQLLKADGDILFNTWRGDVVIFSSNFDWVIAYTIADNWYAGYKKMKRKQ